jgi:hypothetical protein
MLRWEYNVKEDYKKNRRELHGLNLFFSRTGIGGGL